MNRSLSIRGWVAALGLAVTSLMAGPPLTPIAVELIGSFPQESGGIGRFAEAAAIDIDYEGNLYVVDRRRHQLLKFNGKGEFVKQIGGFGRDEEEFDDPRDVSANSTLNIFVADYNNNRVVRYDKNLNFLNTLISKWPEPFNFLQVLSVAVSPQGDLFLLDDAIKRVIKFNRASEPVESFGGIYESFGQLLDPMQVTLDDSQRLFVSDPAQHAVVVFDYLGNYLTEVLYPKLQEPSGLHWGDDRQLYVVDRGTAHIFVFTAALQLAGLIDLSASTEQIRDVAVKYDKKSKRKILYALAPARCWVAQIVSK